MPGHLERINRWLAAILEAPSARLAADVRRAAAGLDGADQAPIPAEARALVEKIRHHAYKITDDDLAALRGAGWDEDALFELTVATAVGQGVRRYRAGMAALAAAKAGR